MNEMEFLEGLKETILEYASDNPEFVRYPVEFAEILTEYAMQLLK